MAPSTAFAISIKSRNDGRTSIFVHHASDAESGVELQFRGTLLSWAPVGNSIVTVDQENDRDNHHDQQQQHATSSSPLSSNATASDDHDSSNNRGSVPGHGDEKTGKSSTVLTEIKNNDAVNKSDSNNNNNNAFIGIIDGIGGLRINNADAGTTLNSSGNNSGVSRNGHNGATIQPSRSYQDYINGEITLARENNYGNVDVGSSSSNSNSDYSKNSLRNYNDVNESNNGNRKFENHPNGFVSQRSNDPNEKPIPTQIADHQWRVKSVHQLPVNYRISPPSNTPAYSYQPPLPPSPLAPQSPISTPLSSSMPIRATTSAATPESRANEKHRVPYNNNNNTNNTAAATAISTTRGYDPTLSVTEAESAVLRHLAKTGKWEETHLLIKDVFNKNRRLCNKTLYSLADRGAIVHFREDDSNHHMWADIDCVRRMPIPPGKAGMIVHSTRSEARAFIKNALSK